MENLNNFDLIIQDVDGKQKSAEIMEIINNLNRLVINDKQNFIELCYWFSRLKKHFQKYDCDNYKYGAYENANKAGRWYFETIIEGFKISEKTVNKMIQISDRFLDTRLAGAPKLRQVLVGMTKTQLMELLPLSDKQIETALQNKRISVDSTKKDVRDYVKSIKGGNKQENKVLEEPNPDDPLDELSIPAPFNPLEKHDRKYYTLRTKDELIYICMEFEKALKKYINIKHIKN